MIFSSLLEGLYYYTECPTCSHPMKIENLGFREIGGKLGNDRGYTLVFSLDYDDKLIINPVTEEIIFDLVRVSNSNVTDHGNYTAQISYIQHKLNTNSQISYNGTMYHSLHVSCSREGCFSYGLNLEINLNMAKLTQVSLSNIKVYIKDGGKTHEIANYYGKKKTSYTTLDVDDGRKSLDIPLIDINVMNPKETLTRIKKLIIFS